MKSFQRRRVLQTMAGLGVVGLAGCNGGQSDPGGSDSSGSTETTVGNNTTTTAQADAELTSPRFHAKLQPEDPVRNDDFGWSVAISGDTAVVGTRHDDGPNGEDSGSASVFRQTGGSWTREAWLTADDGDKEDRFGSTVAVAGDTALVGATTDNPAGANSGTVYVFVRSDGDWDQQAKLVASDGARFDRFGESLALDGDLALIGTGSHAANNGNDSGAVYVFERSGGDWSEEEKIAPFLLDRADFFGRSIALSGDTAVIGAPRDEDPNGSQAGTVYPYRRSNGSWERQGRIVPEEGQPGARFGSSVALVGDTLVVGAPHDGPEAGDELGVGYVFERRNGSWVQQVTLTGSDRELEVDEDDDELNDDTDDLFGHSVALAGGVATVTAPRDEEPNGMDGGSAYVFRRELVEEGEEEVTGVETVEPDEDEETTSDDGEDGEESVDPSWTEFGKVSARHGRPEDRFGWSVSMTEGLALFGVPNEDLAGGHSAGAAHLYDV